MPALPLATPSDPAFDGFINSISKRLAEAGRDGSNLKYANVKGLFDQVAPLQKAIGKNERLDIPEIVRTQGPRLTQQQAKISGNYGKYDTLREQLKRNFGQIGSVNDKVALDKAIDDTLIEMRNEQYAKSEKGAPTAPTAPTALASSDNASTQRSPQERQMVAPAAKPAPSSSDNAGTQRSPQEQQIVAPSAKTQSDSGNADRAAMLFENTHGSAFDPKSTMDKTKMEAILKLMADKSSEKLTPNQFSLRIYRTTK